MAIYPEYCKYSTNNPKNTTNTTNTSDNFIVLNDVIVATLFQAYWKSFHIFNFNFDHSFYTYLIAFIFLNKIQPTLLCLKMTDNNIILNVDNEDNEETEDDLIKGSQPFNCDHLQQWTPPSTHDNDTDNDNNLIPTTTSVPISDDADTITDDETDIKNEPENEPEPESKQECNNEYEWDPYPVDHPEVISFYQDVESVSFRSLQRQATKYTFNPDSKLKSLPSSVCPKFEDFHLISRHDFNLMCEHSALGTMHWKEPMVPLFYNTYLSNLDKEMKRRQRKKHHSSSSKRSNKHSKYSSSSSSSKNKRPSSSSSRKISSKSTSRKTSSSTSSHNKTISNKHKTSKSHHSSSSHSASSSKRGDVKTKTGSSSSSSSKQRVSSSSSSSKKIRTESKSKSHSKSNSKSSSSSGSRSSSKGNKAIFEVKHALKATGTAINYNNNGFSGYNGYNGYNYNYLTNMNVNMNMNMNNNGYGPCYDGNYGNYVDYNQTNYDYCQYYQQQQQYFNHNHYQQFYPNYNQDTDPNMAYFPNNTKLADIAENTNTNDSSSVPSHFSYSS